MIFTAFSAEEAIAKASAFYQCGENQLNIEIKRPPYRRFFGLIKRPGSYRVEYIDPEPRKNVNKGKHRDCSDGKVEIFCGKLKVSNPSTDGGKYASITSDDSNIQVFVNNEEVKGTTIVTEGDWIEFKPKTIEPYTDVRVNISDDGLEATLTIKKIPGKKYFAEDCKSQNSIYIRSNYKKIPAPGVSFDRCIDELIKANVQMKYINTQNIYELIKLEEGGSCVVAKGIPPIDGQDSEIKYLFSNKSYRNPDFDTDKKVDLLDHTIIPTVSVGEVLAIKSMPAIPGRNGETVTGRIIKAKPGKDSPLKAGKGTVLLDNGLKIVASTSGRPVLSRGVVSVIPVITIHKNIDADTGNVYFEGDIIIKGNIMDNIKVKSGGNITVYGNINHACVIARENIKVYGNIIASNVQAGTSIIRYLCVLPKIKKINQLIESFWSFDHKSHMNSQFQNTLSDNKHKIMKTIEEVKKLYALLDDKDINKIDEILDEVQNLIIKINSSIGINSNKISQTQNKIKKYIEDVSSAQSNKADIIFKYSQNSLIQANGSIVVIGQGSYQTNLIAKHSILFQKKSSVVRGGMLIAGHMIKMGMVGSPAGISTYCKVFDKNGKIDAVHFFDNTILTINNETKVINNAFLSNYAEEKTIEYHDQT